jgi:hypothetical protein
MSIQTLVVFPLLTAYSEYGLILHNGSQAFDGNLILLGLLWSKHSLLLNYFQIPNIIPGRL